jgi:hypothetical protein
MKRYLIVSLIGAVLTILIPEPQMGWASRPAGELKTRFAPVHVYLDSGNRPLAAYQFELKAAAGRIKIVGVEGGEHPAFREAPYYDPAALMNERIIIAAFNTGTDLPQGRTRIATLHLQIIGDAEPEYDLKLTTAGGAEGHEISAQLDLERGDRK